ncbi:hypothetical protein H4W80_004995 [Nonomuraea angiospora]|uniref:Integrase catalytic domain-containing protein n=1 Tax=Nonomuraea angiospora TaxID=46172 RepID=A0ABR9M2D7_9ACTN|nr:hypothetical protein [Nonomuraea angiospora]
MRAQYTSAEFAQVCAELGVRQSMGAVGTSDNAAAEAFNATLKRETLQGAKRWSSAREARLAVFKWITRYNTRRRHSTLGYLSPIDYEQQTTDKVLLAAYNPCPHFGASPRCRFPLVNGHADTGSCLIQRKREDRRWR